MKGGTIFMNVLYRIQDMVEEELEIIGKKQEMSSSDIECTYKLIDILKDISTIEAMHDAGYSNDHVDPDMRYIRGNSYRRGRDSMGRYTSREYHDKSGMIEELRELMDMAKSESERESIRRVMDMIKS